jgi:hypothetical protein
MKHATRGLPVGPVPPMTKHEIISESSTAWEAKDAGMRKIRSKTDEHRSIAAPS